MSASYDRLKAVIHELPLLYNVYAQLFLRLTGLGLYIPLKKSKTFAKI
ncbi:hypothetical protein [Tolypothrix sp. NIES-4075]|nr:hypothetical protein [Tolypothrix sp. NIES-4075]